MGDDRLSSRPASSKPVRDATGKTVSSIDEVLRRWMRENRVSERAGERSLFGEWKTIVGDEIAQHTRIVDVRDGELLVEVDSAPLLNELSTYHRREILASLRGNEAFRGVQSIRFRAGAF